MADALKILGQAAPAATTRTDLITVGAAKSQVVRRINCCNTTGSADTVQISVAPAGAAHATAQFQYKDISVPGTSTLELDIFATLAATDVLRVYSGAGSISFTAFGDEIS